jgi:hypothetical protein
VKRTLIPPTFIKAKVRLRVCLNSFLYAADPLNSQYKISVSYLHNMAINYWQPCEEGYCYHLSNRCISDVNLFESTEMSHFFLVKLKMYLSPFMFIYGYCFMPYQFHLLVRMKTNDEINLDKIDWSETKRIQQFNENECGFNTLIED